MGQVVEILQVKYAVQADSLKAHAIKNPSQVGRAASLTEQKQQWSSNARRQDQEARTGKPKLLVEPEQS